jgi:nitronate monooxygenase
MTRELLPGLFLEKPIVQATVGQCDAPALAAAVSDAGGLGSIRLHAPPMEEAQACLQELSKLTERPVLLAFTGPWEPESILDLCLERGFRYFHVFWWNASRLIPRIHAVGGFALQQVGTVPQADEALERGADGLIAQATGAGGQVRSPIPLETLVPALRDRIGPIVPLVAGGGLATADDAYATLALGADAALFGTRFLLSEESDAPLADKRRLLSASTGDLFLDTRLVGDWPCSPRRRLKTEDDCDTHSLYAGLGLDAIHEILPAREIVEKLSPKP